MNDPIIQKAVDLKKATDSVDNPEINAIMGEIMKIILGASTAATDTVSKPKDGAR